MLEKLEDPYTRFMDPEEFKSLQVETSGELSGIGIQIAPDEKTKKNNCNCPNGRHSGGGGGNFG